MPGRARRQEKVDWERAGRKALRELRNFALARRLESPHDRLRFEIVSARFLQPGDPVFVLADDMIPADGEILDGAARVDESAIAGGSEPVLRSAGTAGGGEVAAGTRVRSGWLVLRVTAGPGSCLLAKLVEGTPG